MQKKEKVSYTSYFYQHISIRIETQRIQFHLKTGGLSADVQQTRAWLQSID